MLCAHHPVQSDHPRDATRIEHPDAGAVEWQFIDARGNFGLTLYIGRVRRPAVRTSFPTERARAQYVADALGCLREQVQAKRAQRDAAAARRVKLAATMKVGAVLVASWGYEQTQVDFYEVIGVGRASVTLRALAQTRTASELADRGTCMPVPGHYTGEPFTARVTSSWKGAAAATLGRHGNGGTAHPWDETPQFFSTYY